MKKEVKPDYDSWQIGETESPSLLAVVGRVIKSAHGLSPACASVIGIVSIVFFTGMHANTDPWLICFSIFSIAAIGVAGCRITK